ncbi:uncharacterized protein EDB93DRAFT_868539 [Suillus bovinus]|uniref:uncharacterized protein n=1 Tax=Suillus bovinus TaxID=48563 RepID=UPI001B87CF99|nr:uncharacterized protein EDB93DRAFT_868539 [Suillus bovinus]KAG2156810.1 hypothetical protein EDB93DRAFT_868539 [Suillus bovinus]
MTETPENMNKVLARSLPFPHNMALVCKHWRNIVSSTPELWTRIFWAPFLDDQWVNLQLEKTGSYPVHFIINVKGALSRRFPLSLISSHLQRLKSLTITGVLDEYRDSGMLLGCAPQLDRLRLTDIRAFGCFAYPVSRLKLECPTLRSLYVDKNTMAYYLPHEWLKNNMQHIEVLTIYGGSPINRPTSMAISQTLEAMPLRIPCLILDDLQFYVAYAGAYSITIRADKVILRTCIGDVLTAFDGDCQTIVLRDCDSIHELRCLSLPPSNSLELDGCAATRGLRWVSKTRPWNGDTVTITNSHPSCIKIILYFLGAPFARRNCSLWPRVTTLRLVAKGDFVIELPLMILKEMVSSRQRQAGGQENSGKDGEELEDTVRPLRVLHVHGAQPLRSEEEMWFKKQVRDFVWN